MKAPGAPKAVGQAALQGWRKKVAGIVAPPVAKRAPVSEDAIRETVGVIFLVLSIVYVVKTVKRLLR